MLKAWAGLLLGAALLACTNASSGDGGILPPGWVRECPGNAFCFSRPAALVSHRVQGIDSLVGVYSSDAITLRFDMGAYGQAMDHLVKPVEQATTVGGRPGKLLLTDHEAALVVPKVHEGGRSVTQFTMSLSFKQAASRELAQQIFQSIEFKPPR